MNKKILFLILLAVLILPLSAFADSTVTVKTIIAAAIQTALYIASGVVVILWVITGLLFLTAGGAPDKAVSARKALIAAVAGTALVIVAASAISIVGSAFGLQNLVNNAGS